MGPSLSTPWLRTKGRKEPLSFLLKGVCVKLTSPRIILTQRLAKKMPLGFFFSPDWLGREAQGSAEAPAHPGGPS